jgi:hypothetical protein
MQPVPLLLRCADRRGGGDIALPGLRRFRHPLRHTHLILVPQVLNIRQLPGFNEHRPVVPPGAVYIGRKIARYGLPASKWANPFRSSHPSDRATIVAT